MKQPKIVVAEACDGFTIVIDGKRHWFSQEESIVGLVEMFKELGFESVSYEEDY